MLTMYWTITESICTISNLLSIRYSTRCSQHTDSIRWLGQQDSEAATAGIFCTHGNKTDRFKYREFIRMFTDGWRKYEWYLVLPKLCSSMWLLSVFFCLFCFFTWLLGRYYTLVRDFQVCFLLASWFVAARVLLCSCLSVLSCFNLLLSGCKDVLGGF